MKKKRIEIEDLFDRRLFIFESITDGARWFVEQGITKTLSGAMGAIKYSIDKKIAIYNKYGVRTAEKQNNHK